MVKIISQSNYLNIPSIVYSGFLLTKADLKKGKLKLKSIITLKRTFDERVFNTREIKT